MTALYALLYSIQMKMKILTIGIVATNVLFGHVCTMPMAYAEPMNDDMAAMEESHHDCDGCAHDSQESPCDGLCFSSGIAATPSGPAFVAHELAVMAPTFVPFIGQEGFKITIEPKESPPLRGLNDSVVLRL